VSENSQPPDLPNRPQTADGPSEDNLRVEYQAAQDSAQHHDNLVWSVTSVMWGASLILMGFILAALKDTSVRHLVTVLSLLGIALTICVWVFALQFNSVKRHKYARCKEIEQILHMSQHTTVPWPSGSQRVVYTVLTGFFLMAWVVILCTACCWCAG